MPRKSLLKAICGHDPLGIPLCHLGATPVDGWTIVHIVVYFVFGLYGMDFLELFVSSLAWEYLEYQIQRPRDPHVVSDLVANFVGFALGYWARRHYISSDLPGANFIQLVRKFI